MNTEAHHISILTSSLFNFMFHVSHPRKPCTPKASASCTSIPSWSWTSSGPTLPSNKRSTWTKGTAVSMVSCSTMASQTGGIKSNTSYLCANSSTPASYERLRGSEVYGKETGRFNKRNSWWCERWSIYRLLWISILNTQHVFLTLPPSKTMKKIPLHKLLSQVIPSSPSQSNRSWKLLSCCIQFSQVNKT